MNKENELLLNQKDIWITKSVTCYDLATLGKSKQKIISIQTLFLNFLSSSTFLKIFFAKIHLHLT